MRNLILGLTAAMGLALPAKSDHYLATADPQMVQAISMLIGLYEQQCMIGNQAGCQGLPQAQAEGWAILDAGYRCQNGDPSGCQMYEYGVQMIGGVMYQIQQQQLMSMAQFAGNGGGGAMSHYDRMQQIHNWGQTRLAIGQQNMDTMQSSHESFLNNVIRN